MSRDNSSICFVAGRSGGHLIPCITLAHTYANKNPERDLLLFSTATSLDKKIMDAESPFTQWVPLNLDNFPYKKLYNYPKFIWQFACSFITSVYYLRKQRPAKVISLGGYISIPVCLAARTLGIPVELFELNVLPGRTISLLAPLAQKILICFEKTKKYFPKTSKCVLTDYPIRFNEQARRLSQESAIKQLELNPEKRTLLILGGSQGSVFINTAIKQWLSYTPEAHSNLQVIHQTGEKDATDWQQFYKNMHIPALTFTYSHNMAAYYAAADLVVCRSGAGTLFEIGFFNKQCMTIPLETQQTNHQWHNGKMIAKLWPDLVTVLKQQDVEKTPSLLADAIYRQLFVHHRIKAGMHKEIAP